MKSVGLIIPVIALLLFFPSCGKVVKDLPETNLRDYYFPYRSMMDTLVYRYTYDSIPDMEYFSVMFTTVESGDTFFNTFIYSGHYSVSVTAESMKEKITPTGTELVASSFRSIGVGMKIPNINNYRVNKGQMYAWFQTEADSLYLETVGDYITPDSLSYVSGKTRTFAGIKPVLYNGQQVAGAEFKDSFVAQGYNRTTWTPARDRFEFYRVNYFAKGIGLVRFYQREPYKSYSVHLDQVIPFSEWEYRDIFRMISQFY